MKSKKEKSTDQDDTPKVKERNIRKLQKQVEELTKEKDKIFEQLQRVSADYTNYQKRTPKQIADSVSYEKKSIIRSLLPSLDNFDHALAGAESAESAESVIEGMRLIFAHLLDALRAHGVKIIETKGQQFDPALHEAVMQKAETDKADGIILEEFQRGYTLNGQVVRPSKVIVNKLPADDIAEDINEDGDEGEEASQADQENDTDRQE